jgi:fermentation-respiration switch protein FrsA (DUF1100 family)
VVVVTWIIPTGRYETRGKSADNACTPGHTNRIFDAIKHPDKTLYVVRGATHYYAGPDQRPKLNEAIGVITPRLAERGLAPRL